MDPSKKRTTYYVWVERFFEISAFGKTLRDTRYARSSGRTREVKFNIYYQIIYGE
ncbi:MAG: hypothetical protein US03_C0015G0028 [candidate division TM6 bacterium GW2011_GWF2_36_131]|nr:MAG: hypothetical protein US03_C0015G0028 [candidate division TM6 bacterium GW2011_GWF2_36_131]KKQ18983.1 MAG: hypothetical protein US32_C0019G0026 [candidate division TM6 bacterium GW2011_GWA2_36_9]